MPKIYKRFCNNCGRYYEGQGSKFCSPECAGSVKKYSFCKMCGKRFHKKVRYRNTFCSRECADRWRKENPPNTKKIKLTCAYCGKEFVVIPSKSNRKYCCHYHAILASVKKRKYWATVVKKHSASIKNKYFNIKNRAIKTGKTYPSKEEFIDWYQKQEKKCVYCDIPQEYWEMLYNGYQNKYSLSIDRKDNTKGYDIENMVLACGKCNMIKNDILSYEEMKEIGQKYIKPKWLNMLTTIKKRRTKWEQATQKL